MDPPVSPYLAEGARLLAAGDYFLSHETLEEYWVDAPEAERDLLQALIHLAVGFLHHEKGNLKGARLQFRKASRRIEGYDAGHDVVDVAAVRAFLDGLPAELDGEQKMVPPRILRQA